MRRRCASMRLVSSLMVGMICGAGRNRQGMPETTRDVWQPRRPGCGLQPYMRLPAGLNSDLRRGILVYRDNGFPPGGRSRPLCTTKLEVRYEIYVEVQLREHLERGWPGA